jgi:hypothetical protein
MTSVTHDLLVSVSLAAQGARRATGAVKETAGQISSEPIVVLVNDHIIHRNAKVFVEPHRWWRSRIRKQLPAAP